MASFRSFIRAHDFPCSLREQDAPPPANPENKTNKHHFDFLQQGLGIADKDFDAALEGSQTLYQLPDYGWGFKVNPPVQVIIKHRSDGNYDVTFMLSQKKITNPKSFVLPYKQDEQPTYYEGPVEDKTEVMSQEELSNAMAKPLEGGGAQMGMGGMPPMGGGGMM